MFYALSKIFDVLLSPLTWAILLCLTGTRLRGSTGAVLSPLAAALLLYVFSVDRVSNALMRRLETATPSTQQHGVVYDAVVLLGGAVAHAPTESSGLPSYNDNVERLLTTFDLLRTGRAKNAIVTGGTGDLDDSVVEATVLSSQLESWGIEPSRLLLEKQARNTRENAEFTRKIVDEHHLKRVLLVTSAFHMQRALDCFREVGLSVDALPVDYRTFDPGRHRGSWLPRAGALADSTNALRELFGRLVYRVVGYGR
jgi:uncharacterized SAM-binding protein YcdF (DUF218 family)